MRTSAFVYTCAKCLQHIILTKLPNNAKQPRTIHFETKLDRKPCAVRKRHWIEVTPPSPPSKSVPTWNEKAARSSVTRATTVPVVEVVKKRHVQTLAMTALTVALTVRVAVAVVVVDAQVGV